MKDLTWAFAGVALILVGCGDKEQTEHSQQIDQSVREAPADMVTDSVVETPAEPVEETVFREVEPMETAQEITDLTREPVAGALETIKGDAGASTDVAAGAVLAGNVPAGRPVP